MSGYIGDFKAGQVVRLAFNTVNTGAAPTTLTTGSAKVSKDGADVTPSGGITLTVDANAETGSHRVTVDTSVDPATFTAGSDYKVRLSGTSAVAGVSVVGTIIGEFSIQNRSVATNGTGQVSLNLGQTGLAPRALDAVADAALTVGDALVGAICAAAGKEAVAGTGYTVKTPFTGTVIRTFTLDSASAPTTRN